MKSVVYINNLEGNHHADHDVNMYDVPDYSIDYVGVQLLQLL